MVRVTNAVASHRRKKRIFKQAKGFWGDRKNHLRLSMDAVMRAMASNYTHRKLKKRDFRSLWITRLGIASKMIVNGDVTQIDLEFKKSSGFVQALQILKNVSEVQILQFTEQDVVRHSLVRMILKAYDVFEKSEDS